MRIVTFDDGRGPRAGVLRDDGVVDAGGRSVRELLAAGRLDEIPAGEPIALDAVRLLPPIPDPDKIVCIGLNFRAHAREAVIGAAGRRRPSSPSTATRSPRPGRRSTLPRFSSKVDYEARGRVRDRQAREGRGRGRRRSTHVAGYMLLQRPLGTGLAST